MINLFLYEKISSSEKIKPNFKYSIENKGANLIIKNVNKFDIGEYECVARNQLGEAKSSTYLQIKQSSNNHPSEQNIEDIYTRDGWPIRSARDHFTDRSEMIAIRDRDPLK